MVGLPCNLVETCDQQKLCAYSVHKIPNWTQTTATDLLTPLTYASSRPNNLASAYLQPNLKIKNFNSFPVELHAISVF
jgi:hypothetical protein